MDCQFFASENGEPFCAFVYGHLPFEQVTTQYVRTRIEREIDVWELDTETVDDIQRAMQAEPAHLFIRQEGTFEDSPFYFCEAEDAGAIAITGWKLR